MVSRNRELRPGPDFPGISACLSTSDDYARHCLEKANPYQMPAFALASSPARAMSAFTSRPGIRTKVRHDDRSQTRERTASPRAETHTPRARETAMSRLDLIHDWLEMAERAHYSPSKLARQCGVSIRHLRRYFNCRCRQTPRAWLREVRLWKSIQLLLLQRSTIKEVAFALHFTRATTFHHLFTEEFQTPPLRLLANPRASNTLIARIKQARGHAAPGPRQSLRQLQDSVLALAMRRRL